MILNKYIIITTNPSSLKHYISLGYNCKNYESLKIKTTDLSKGSNVYIDILCDNCKDELKTKYNKYYKSTNGLTEDYLCKKCNHVKAKKTKLERYGSENYINITKTKETNLERYGVEYYNNRNKAKETNLERYGVDNISKHNDIKEKKKETNLERYGVENIFQSDNIKNKIKETNLERYGVEFYITSDDAKKKYNNFCKSIGVSHYSKSDEFKERFEKTCLRKWGVKTNLLDYENIKRVKQTNLLLYGFDNVMRNKDISLLNKKTLITNRASFFKNLGYTYIDYDHNEFLYKLNSDICDHTFEINYDLFRSRVKYNNNCCITCYPKSELSSIKEKEVVNWLRGLGVEVIENDRSLIKKEIDIYLPQLKLGIEFNGLYYHSDKFKEKNYHIDKTIKCKELGIQLIHIWEDDWVFKNDIIKSILLNRINNISEKIYARKCKIRIVDSKVSKIFLNDNHIQGNTTSSIRIGLFHNNELVSLMTLGNRNINSIKTFELIRFCNKINVNVIGGASKIFKYFLKNYDYEKITSYSDISIFSGQLYENLGFINDGNTSLNYYWTDLNRKYHRFNFNKKKLIKMGYDRNLTEEQIMKNIGYYKIWSCGQIRWIIEK